MHTLVRFRSETPVSLLSSRARAEQGLDPVRLLGPIVIRATQHPLNPVEGPVLTTARTERGGFEMAFGMRTKKSRVPINEALDGRSSAPGETYLDPGSVLQTKRGSLVVERSTPHGDRWRVQFGGVGERNAAEALRGTELFAEPIDDPDALWIHELIGASVELEDRSPVGRIASVESAGASDLLVLEDGRMIPLAFVVDKHGSAREGFFVVVDPPPGLLNDAESV